MRSCQVVLGWEEMEKAAMIGLRRRFLQVRRDAPNAHQLEKQFGRRGAVPEAYEIGIDIKGAWGELAFAKFLGIPWTMDVDTFKKPDVGGFQVRTIGIPDHCLIIREDDPPGPYVLVLGHAQNYQVMGWIRSEYARSQSAWIQNPSNRPPAVFVPTKELRPFTDVVWNRLQQAGVVAR